MIFIKEVSEYIDLVENNEINVSEEVHLLINNEVKPLLNGDTAHLFFDEVAFHECIKFIERFYFPLFPYQKFLVAFHFLYEIIEDFKILYYNEYLYELGRGNGKDGLIAPLANFFMTKKFGVKNYNIDIIANAEEQSKDTFDVVYNMTQSSAHKELMKANFKINKEEIISKTTGSKLTYNTSNGKTKDGRKPGCLIFNELHAYKDYSQINVHESGKGKVEFPRTIIITTNGDVRDGPLDDKLDISLQKLRGEHPTLRLFPFICKLNDDDIKNKRYNDIETLEKANPSLRYRNVLKTQILDDIIKIKVNPSLLEEFIMKRCNVPQNNTTTAIIEWEYIKACTKDLPPLEGKNCIMGIDYSSFRDFVSVGFLFFENEEWVWVQHTFVCRNSPTLGLVKFDFSLAERNGELTWCEGESIDDNIIEEYIRNQAQIYNIRLVACDSFRYNLVKDMLLRMGLTERNKKNPYGNIILVRSGAITHSLLFPELEQSFVNKKINYGPSRIMRWYTNNTKKVKAGKGNIMFDKINPESRKNDGFMAFVHAFSVRNEEI